jgi:hypothetical protein
MCSTVNHQSDRFSRFLRARMGTSVLVPLHIVNDAAMTRKAEEDWGR